MNCKQCPYNDRSMPEYCRACLKNEKPVIIGNNVDHWHTTQ